MLGLTGEAGLGLASFAVGFLALGDGWDGAARARWLQGVSRRVLRLLGVTLAATGGAPRQGLLVCNHLSYVDVLVLSALSPCVFVAKSEVRRWPLFGAFASLAGTLFVDREKRVDAARAVRAIRAALDAGLLVVLFAEGTTSDGSAVLPFKPSLLQPVVDAPHHLTVGCLRYALAEGRVADEVCYWRDMTLVPHLLNLMGKRGFSVEVAFAEIVDPAPDRKALARQLHGEVVRLNQAMKGAGELAVSFPPESRPTWDKASPMRVASRDADWRRDGNPFQL